MFTYGDRGKVYTITRRKKMGRPTTLFSGNLSARPYITSWNVIFTWNQSQNGSGRFLGGKTNHNLSTGFAFLTLQLTFFFLLSPSYLISRDLMDIVVFGFPSLFSFSFFPGTSNVQTRNRLAYLVVFFPKVPATH